jgi:hypothetical protein
MLKFIGKALAGMVLTKEAREAAGGLTDRAVQKAVQKVVGGKFPDAQEQGVADVPVPTVAPAVPDRAELIRRAMEVRAAQQTVLADLKPEERAKLTATAMRAFLNESKSRE